MSLDITLRAPETTRKRGTGVFVRENGANVELTPEQVRGRWPGSNVTEEVWETDEVFDRNITHNLTKMAAEAGLYEAMWRPDEQGWTKARDVIQPLSDGLLKLLDEPEHFRTFNPPNGWGDYDGFVDAVRAYLGACVTHPDAVIDISR